MDTNEITRAVEWMSAKRPHYASLLRFYGPMFVLQEKSRQVTLPPPLALSRENLLLRSSQGVPLILNPEFPVDMEAAQALFLDLCGLAMDRAPNLAHTAEKARKMVADKMVPFEELITALLDISQAGVEVKEGQGIILKETAMDRAANDLDLDRTILTFLLFQSVQPSFVSCAESLPGIMKREIPWTKGPCPVCGSEPVVAVLDPSGKRTLHCGYCWYSWNAPRIFCVFCGNKNHESLIVHSVEQEPEYRLDACRVCGRYLKTIDSRNTTRPVYPPLEHYCTAHLEMIYKESVAH